jgi:nuclear transport factor 2 (NTF2) superfamily protein
MPTAPLTTRPPLPPFTRESAIQKVRLAEDAWNTRDPGKVVPILPISRESVLTSAIRWETLTPPSRGQSSLLQGPLLW